MARLDWALAIVVGVYLWFGQYLTDLVFFTVGALLVIIVLIRLNSVGEETQ